MTFLIRSYLLFKENIGGVDAKSEWVNCTYNWTWNWSSLWVYCDLTLTSITLVWSKFTTFSWVSDKINEIVHGSKFEVKRCDLNTPSKLNVFLSLTAWNCVKYRQVRFRQTDRRMDIHTGIQTSTIIACKRYMFNKMHKNIELLWFMFDNRPWHSWYF